MFNINGSLKNFNHSNLSKNIVIQNIFSYIMCNEMNIKLISKLHHISNFLENQQLNILYNKIIIKKLYQYFLNTIFTKLHNFMFS
jgi:hypothetical protein